MLGGFLGFVFALSAAREGAGRIVAVSPAVPCGRSTQHHRAADACSEASQGHGIAMSLSAFGLQSLISKSTNSHDCDEFMRMIQMLPFVLILH